MASSGTSVGASRPTTTRSRRDQQLDLAVKACTHTAACGRKFVEIQRLTRWLRSPPHGSSTPHIHRILETVFADDVGRVRPVIDIKDGTSNRVDIVFAILHEIRQLRLIVSFQQAGIVDSRLPLNLRTLEETIREAGICKEKFPGPDAASRQEQAIVELVESFDKYQYQFRPHIFRSDGEPRLSGKHILPVLERNEIGYIVGGVFVRKEGGTAYIYRLAVLKEFLSKEILDVVKNTPFEGDGKVYNIIVKEYRDADKAGDIWKNEKDVLERLRGSDARGVGRYLGCYVKQDHQSLRKTLNIMLEPGEYDLGDFFLDDNRIYLPGHIKEFWQNVFGLVNSLVEIHDFREDVGGQVYRSSVLHADLKPENIMNFQGQWKFVDLGFARIIGEGVDKTRISGYTRTYGAPECRPGRSPADLVSASIDVWSLGCVFSMVATWLVLGVEGTRQFQRVRSEAITRLLATKKDSTMHEGDFFHDGHELLAEVREWHQYLKIVSCKTDFMTHDVLDIVEQYMLLADPNSRKSAKVLQEKLQKLTESWRKRSMEMRETVSPSILAALLSHKKSREQDALTIQRADGDQHVDSGDATSRTSRKQFSNAKKSRIRRNHADAFSASVIWNTPSTGGEVDEIKRKTNASGPVAPSGGQDGMPPPLPGLEKTLSRKQVTIVEPSIRQTTSIESDARPATRRSRAKPTPDPENVFQAMAKFRQTSRMKSRKDKKLIEEYKKRDIIFLIDNSPSVEEHFDEARAVLDVLLQKCRGIDDNGVDLSFTCSSTKIRSKSVSALLKVMDDSRERPSKQRQKNVSQILKLILDGYLRELDKYDKRSSKSSWQAGPWSLSYDASKAASGQMRPATLIFLTNGVWNGCAKTDVDAVIINFLHSLHNRRPKPLERQFTIQFVHLGTDQLAAGHLERLDDNLGTDGLPDVIDTETSLGDVYKMLLGSLKPEYDDLDENHSASTANNDASSNVGSSQSSQSSIKHKLEEIKDDLRHLGRNLEPGCAPASAGANRTPSPKPALQRTRSHRSENDPSSKDKPLLPPAHSTASQQLSSASSSYESYRRPTSPTFVGRPPRLSVPMQRDAIAEESAPASAVDGVDSASHNNVSSLRVDKQS